MSEKPNYINYRGEIVMRPSFQFNITQIYTFVVKADKIKLQDTLYKRLNKAFIKSYLRYKPLGTDVFFTFSVTDAGYSMNNVSKKQGYITEEEMAVWIPVIEEKYDGVKWSVHRIVLFIPFIFVNNPIALIAGREVYGFPKALGVFRIPDTPNNATLFTVDTMSFTESSSKTPLLDKQLLKIESLKSVSNKTDLKVWNTGMQTAFEVGKILWKETGKKIISEWGLYGNLFKDLVRLQIPSVFLKQFRSAQNDGKAVYQALIDSAFKINGFNGGGMLHDDYILSLSPNDSFPLQETLGLRDGQKIEKAFWVNVDFENLIGTELYVS